MKSLLILSGAGMSAESGIRTFRDSDGLWENHRIEEVATPEAWEENPELVRNFYNLRYLNMKEAKPNEGHKSIAALQHYFDVKVVTQNVDDLHERAGSKTVLHLHGELKSMCSTRNRNLKRPYQYPLTEIYAPDGSLWRPDIVWFGEAVPNYELAEKWIKEADIFVIIGTSLQVAPASLLADASKPEAKKILIDPNFSNPPPAFLHLPYGAVEGTGKLWDLLKKEYLLS